MFLSLIVNWGSTKTNEKQKKVEIKTVVDWIKKKKPRHDKTNKK